MFKVSNITEDTVQNVLPTDVLLAWAKAVTHSYKLPITNFTTSWQDGKVFAAIMHYFNKIELEWNEVSDSRTAQGIVQKFSKITTNLLNFSIFFELQFLPKFLKKDT